MTIMAMSYVALKNDVPKKFMILVKNKGEDLLGFFKSLVLTGLTYFGLMITFWVIGALQFIIRLGEGTIVFFDHISFPVEKQYYDFFYTYGYSTGEVFPEWFVPRMGLLENLALNQMNLFFGFIFLIIGLGTLLLCLHICYKKALKVMLKNLRLLDTTLLLSAAFLGIASLHLIDGDFSKGWAIDPFYVLHLPYVLFALFTLFLLAQFSFLLNDLHAYDRGDDLDNPLSNGSIPIYHYKQLTAAYGLAALFISFILGRWTLLLALIWITVSFLLARMSNESRYSGLINGGAFGALAFLFGYYTPGSWIAFILEHADGEWIYASNETLIRTPGFSSGTIVLLLTVLLGLSLLSLYSKKGGLFYSKLEKSLDTHKLVYIITPVIFLLPLLSHDSLFAIIITLSLASGTIVCYKILDIPQILKIGFIISLFLFSLTII